MFISAVSVGAVTALCLTLLEVLLSAQGVLKGLEASSAGGVAALPLGKQLLNARLLVRSRV